MVLDSESLFLKVMLNFKMGLLSWVTTVVSIKDGIANVISVLICQSKQSPYPKSNINHWDKNVLETNIGENLVGILFQKIVVQKHYQTHQYANYYQNESYNPLNQNAFLYTGSYPQN